MVQAVAKVGFGDPVALRHAMHAVCVVRREYGSAFDDAFDRTFLGKASTGESLEERLIARGFSPEEAAQVKALVRDLAAAGDVALAAWLERRADLDRLLLAAPSWRSLASADAAQVGFLAHRLSGEMKLAHAYDGLALLESQLSDALGATRAAELRAALKEEVDRARDLVLRMGREYAEESSSRRIDASSGPMLVAPLSDEEARAVEHAITRFVERLEGKARVRRKHARRGRISASRTIRAAQRTGGVPMRLVYKKRRTDKPKLFVLCDISESVRNAARFLLALTHSAQNVFQGTRSFLFVSDVGEATELFAREPLTTALAHAWSGQVVSITSNSNYGRVLRAFESRFGDEIDKKTTLLVLGDGRTNYADDGRDALARLRDRAKSLLWLCPERRGSWGVGDSAMLVYESRASRAIEVSTLDDLFGAIRLLK
jgi:uncharacterized protein with von Willebrand factor type A (vWA) domain